MTDPTLVPVTVPCQCPGAPHGNGDTVYLRPTLTLHGGMVAQSKIIDLNNRTDIDNAEVMAELAEVFCRYGVVEWTFTDEAGEVPVNPDTIQQRLLDNFDIGYIVADQAADHYSKGLLDPLRAGVSKSLPRSRTNGSTSAPTALSDTPRKRSKRSSTSTTQTGATATTSG